MRLLPTYYNSMYKLVICYLDVGIAFGIKGPHCHNYTWAPTTIKSCIKLEKSNVHTYSAHRTSMY